MFRAPCAHRQKGKIVLYSLWYHHTETSEWSKITEVIKITKINQLNALNFIMSLFHASTCFGHHVLIVRRAKLCYTVCGIITQKQVSGLKQSSAVVGRWEVVPPLTSLCQPPILNLTTPHFFHRSHSYADSKMRRNQKLH